MYILLTRAKIVVLDLTVMSLALSRAKIVILVCSQVQQEVLVLPPARIAPLAEVLRRWEWQSAPNVRVANFKIKRKATPAKIVRMDGSRA